MLESAITTNKRIRHIFDDACSRSEIVRHIEYSRIESNLITATRGDCLSRPTYIGDFDQYLRISRYSNIDGLTFLYWAIEFWKWPICCNFYSRINVRKISRTGNQYKYMELSPVI